MSALKKFLLSTLALPCLAAAQAPAGYHATLVSRNWSLAALNDGGQVAFADESGRAWIWSRQDGIRPMPGDATESSVFALNNQGTAVGSAWLPGQDYYKPVAWHTSPGMERVEIVGAGGEARAINDDGAIVGSVVGADSKPRGFVHSKAGNIHIDDFYPAAINEAGDVAGMHGGGIALWRDGALTEVPGSGGAWAEAMNNSGWIVGTTGLWEATLWRDGEAVKLWQGFATDVNDAGVVVGSAVFGRAMLWVDGKAYLLDHLWNEPGWLSWSLRDLLEINEAGEILAWAQDETDGGVAILLLSPLPVPEPGRAALMLAGMAGLALLGGPRLRSARRSA
jgi:uncharacterized membrane protein